MNAQTLHQCNIHQVIDFDYYAQLISIDDALIFYGHSMLDEQKQLIIKKFKNKALYFLINNNAQLSNITYDRWVDLIQNCKRTLTWK